MAGYHKIAVDALTPKNGIRNILLETNIRISQNIADVNNNDYTDSEHIPKAAVVALINAAVGDSSPIILNSPGDDSLYLSYDAGTDKITFLINGRYGANSEVVFKVIYDVNNDSVTDNNDGLNKLIQSNTMPIYTWNDQTRTVLQSVIFAPAGLTQSLYDAGAWQIKLFDYA